MKKVYHTCFAFAATSSYLCSEVAAGGRPTRGGRRRGSHAFLAAPTWWLDQPVRETLNTPRPTCLQETPGIWPLRSTAANVGPRISPRPSWDLISPGFPSIHSPYFFTASAMVRASAFAAMLPPNCGCSRKIWGYISRCIYAVSTNENRRGVVPSAVLLVETTKLLSRGRIKEHENQVLTGALIHRHNSS